MMDDRILDGTGTINHIAVAVHDTEAALALYSQALGLPAQATVEHPPEGVRVTFREIGQTKIELLEPLAADSAVGRFLEKRGEGLHHICLEVDDLSEAIARLRDRGFNVIDETPREGMHGEKLVFIHPKSAFGVLLELYERGIS